ncbi:unnamed protein product [Adineta steineri]|uniref:Uncharacterized protein n=1 Tax=Adineta steineri TaxID=433720 RepID=A0A815LQE4_9BILA|nr:unnamed protein product [Adineta steineri]CAF3969431.1 unnamed protein product [Adineta steineri]
MYGGFQQPISRRGSSVNQLLSNGSIKWQQSGVVVAGDNLGRAGGDANLLNNPSNVAFDSRNQYFYVTDDENSRIQRYSVNNGGDRAGTTVYKLDDSPVPSPWDPSDRRNRPSALCIDSRDNIYIAEMYAPRRILRISPDGRATTVIDPRNSILQSCSGIYVDRNGNIYVSDWQQSAVLKFDQNGQNGEIVAGGNGYGHEPNQLYHPMGIFVTEKTGNLYVADYVNQCVRRWSPGSKAGVVVAGGNFPGTDLNQLNYPSSVFVDDDERQIYVGDSINARVVRWSAGAQQGEIIVGANNLTSESREICRVSGFKFDQNGNLYIADNYGNRIRKYMVDN